MLSIISNSSERLFSYHSNFTICLLVNFFIIVIPMDCGTLMSTKKDWYREGGKSCIITLFFWYETSFLSNTEMKSSSACLGLFPCIYFCLQYSTYDWLLFPELYGFLGIALLISSSLIFRAVNAYLAAVLSLSLQQVIHLKKLQCICWLSSICCSGTHHHGTNQK